MSSISNKSKKLSALLDRFLPTYIRDEYSQFSKFLEYYLTYLESKGQVITLILDFLHIIDIDQIAIDGSPYDPYSYDLSILEQYIYQYISDFPLYRLEDIDIRKLIKQAKNFYNTVGTENSFQFIFRLMSTFGSFSFYYPYKYLLKCSDPYDGNISSNHYIHDNYKFAYYTYEIRSTEFGYVELKDILENLLHIVGCKVFFLRYVQDDADMDPYTGSGSEYLVFALDDLSIQWIEFLTIAEIYNSGLWTYEDWETGSTTGWLSYFTYTELGDIFYNLENPSSNLNIFSFQKATEFSLE